MERVRLVELIDEKAALYRKYADLDPALALVGEPDGTHGPNLRGADARIDELAEESGCREPDSE